MAFGLYVAQTWVDGSASTPLSAARMGALETGVFNAHYMPAVRVYNTASQSVASSASGLTAMAFPSERFDTAGNAADTMHDNSTNNSRLIARYSGKYYIAGHIEIDSNATGYRVLAIRLNGTSTLLAKVTWAGYTGVSNAASISTIYDLAPNDYVELVVTQTSGGPLNVTSGANYSPEFMMARVA